MKQDARLTFVALSLIRTVALASLLPAMLADILRLIVTVLVAKDGRR
jgi:hypothetical protein